MIRKALRSWIQDGDFKEVSQDLLFHEQALQQQNKDLEDMLLRLKRAAEMKNEDEQESDDEESDADSVDYKMKARECQVNIAAAEARQQELQKLIQDLSPPRRPHAQ